MLEMPLYELRLYDPPARAAPYFAPREVFPPGVFKQGFRYQRALNDHGSWAGTLDAGGEIAGAFARNCFLEVRRRFPSDADWSVEFVGIVKFEDVVETESARQLTVGGPGLEWLLWTERVRRDAHTFVSQFWQAGATMDEFVYGGNDGYTVESGPADYVMKVLVRDTVGPGAPPESTFPWLFTTEFLPEDQGGPPQNVYLRYENLLGTLKEIASRAQVDFWLAFDPPGDNRDGRVWFYAGARGEDRSERVAAFGQPAMIFSDLRGNIVYPRLRDDWMGAETGAYVLGQGAGVLQDHANFPEYGSAFSPDRMDRAMGVVSARNVNPGDVHGLLLAGRSHVYARGPRRTFEFETRETPESRYGIHYNLGDRVTCALSYRNYAADYRIAAVEVTLDEGGYLVTPEFARV